MFVRPGETGTTNTAIGQAWAPVAKSAVNTRRESSNTFLSLRCRPIVFIRPWANPLHPEEPENTSLRTYENPNEYSNRLPLTSSHQPLK
jgi:hypothetical protein